MVIPKMLRRSRTSDSLPRGKRFLAGIPDAFDMLA